LFDLSKITEFDWDAGNARTNERHGVSAGEAEEVFFSMPLLLLDHSHEEPRYHALGVTAAARRLHLSFTLRREGTAIRVISAREMSRKAKG
jgi:uncharacterized protein